jgi:nucleoside phosphorylase
MGNNMAATVSTHLLRSFPRIVDVLMVDIAGGVPNPAKPLTGRFKFKNELFMKDGTYDFKDDKLVHGPNPE